MCKCDLLIPNELSTALLSTKQKEALRETNISITKKVVRFVCPSLDSLFGPVVLRAVKELADRKAGIAQPATQEEDEQELCTITLAKAKRLQCGGDELINLTPTNTILYGTTICQSLGNLNVAGFSNEEIVCLTKRYNVVWPWSVQYNTDRLGANKRIQVFPLIVVFPRTVEEVQTWVCVARLRKLTVSIRSGGHSFEYFSGFGALIIDVSDLVLCWKKKNKKKNKTRLEDQVWIDEEAMTVDVTPGVRLGPLYAATEQKGLQLAGGICVPVCIGGFISGGGIGFLTRERGFGCDSLLEADLVIADGSFVQCSQSENPDILKAIKGAGWAGLGAIVRYRLQLYRAQKLVNFTYAFAVTDAAAIFVQLQSMTDTAPVNLSGIVGNVIAGSPVMVVNGVYRPFLCACCPESKEVALAQFHEVIQANFFAGIPGVVPLITVEEFQNWTDIDTQLGFEAPSLPNAKIRTSYVFAPLSLAAWQSVLDLMLPPPIPTFGQQFFFALQLEVLGGAVKLADNVLSGRLATAWVQLGFYYDNSNDQPFVFDLINSVYDALVAAGSTTFADSNVTDLLLLNFPTDYWASNVSFLQDIRRRLDPTGVFHFPQAIPLP